MIKHSNTRRICFSSGTNLIIQIVQMNLDKVLEFDATFQEQKNKFVLIVNENVHQSFVQLKLAWIVSYVVRSDGLQ